MEITPEINFLFSEYEKAKLEIKKLEEKIDEIKPKILEFVPDDKMVALEKGYVYTQERAKWVFSKDVEAKENEIDEMKKEEKAKGIATATYTKTLFYKENE